MINTLATHRTTCTTALGRVGPLATLMEQAYARWHKWQVPYIEQYNWLKGNNITDDNMQRDTKLMQLKGGMDKVDTEIASLNGQAKPMYNQADAALNAMQQDLETFDKFIIKKKKGGFWKSKKSLPDAEKAYALNSKFLTTARENLVEWRDLFTFL
jgi:hypothetical protein